MWLLAPSSADGIVGFNRVPTVTSISPSHVVANTTATVVVEGKNLKGIAKCSVSPVSAATGETIVGDCKAEANSAGTELVLTIPSTLIPVAGEYVIRLDKGSVFVASGRIHADATVDTKSQAKGGGSGDSTHPYTDCLSDTGIDGPVGLVNAPVNGVLCSASVIPYGEVSDEFGYHVSDMYSAIQVRVSNKNSQYDFLLRDVVLTLPDGRIVSGRIRRLAQGVAVKGKTHDPRSIWFNSLTATGGVYGALASFGSAGFTTAGNVFQGAFLGAFNQIFPDYTADNVNRFNNAIFDDQNPSIVPKDSIGQPPLYVVALVPKEPKTTRTDAYQSAKRIQVSIEGTFIKQVTPLGLSSTTLQYKAQFISPETVFTDKDKTFDFSGLRSVSDEQPIVMSNMGSTLMTVHGFKIVQGGKGATDASPDFSEDVDKSNCGVGGTTTKASDGTKGFTLAPNASCTITVQFHPTTVGPIQASLTFDGDNLEGATSVGLTGTGVGLIVQAKDARNPALSHTFACSYSATDCSFDIGFQTVGGNATLNVYYFTDTLTDTLTFAPVAGGTAPVGSKGMVPKFEAATVSTQPVTITAGAKETALTVTDNPAKLFKTPYKILLKYQTVETTMVVDALTAAFDKNGLPVAGKSPSVMVQATGGGATPTGNVVFTFSNVADGTTILQTKALNAGQASPDLSGLAAGTYSLTASYPSTDVFEAASMTGSVTVAVTQSITQGIPVPALKQNTPSDVPVTVTNLTAGPCSGGIVTTITAGGNSVASTAKPVTGKVGVWNVNFTPTVPGPYSLAVTYTPDVASSCKSGSQTFQIAVPQQ